MSPLKLGKLPDRETTKITFAASAELSKKLDDYAKAYEAEYGRAEKVEDLIPHLLEAFMKADRGFRSSRMKLFNSSEAAIGKFKEDDR